MNMMVVSSSIIKQEQNSRHQRIVVEGLKVTKRNKPLTMIIRSFYSSYYSLFYSVGCTLKGKYYESGQNAFDECNSW